MQVILLEKVVNLGGLGDVVKVRDGFARNYLIPNKKAKLFLDSYSTCHDACLFKSNGYLFVRTFIFLPGIYFLPDFN